MEATRLAGRRAAGYLAAEMPGLFKRLFGTAKPSRDYHEGPPLGGLDPVSELAIAAQKQYWRPAPKERAELEARDLHALGWPELLRLHHLRCLDLLRAPLREALLAPDAERTETPPPDPNDLEAVAETAGRLLSRRSPYRPRHGFAWLGAGPPGGAAIPYSDHQGRTINASLTHLGALEVLTLDERLERPVALEFIPFDDLMTLSCAALPQGAAPPPFRPARLLREYAKPELTVLLPTRYGLSWLSYEPAILRGKADRALAPVTLRGLADPTKVVVNPNGDRRELSLRIGPQRVEILSDYVDEGLGAFELGDCYQLSLAIDQDDPQFNEKCLGRGLDPRETRGDVVAESRLRASARARSTETKKPS